MDYSSSGPLSQKLLLILIQDFIFENAEFDFKFSIYIRIGINSVGFQQTGTLSYR